MPWKRLLMSRTTGHSSALVCVCVRVFLPTICARLEVLRLPGYSEEGEMQAALTQDSRRRPTVISAAFWDAATALLNDRFCECSQPTSGALSIRLVLFHYRSVLCLTQR